MFNRRQFLATSGAAASLAVGSSCIAASPNDKIGLAFIGFGGRAGSLLNSFTKFSDVEVVAIAEPDTDRLAQAKERAPNAVLVQDMTEVIDRPDVDAVVIATTNHWHCLAAIRACKAGKDVYVEKPLGHNLYEQEQLVKAARKYDRMVQVGTQQRSSEIQARAKELLHKEKVIGDLKYGVVSRIGRRASIGKRSEPLQVASSVDYNQWIGPAPDEPLYRDKLHYDWHWDWNTGNGEMGNWGVHVLDDMLNVGLMDKAGFPTGVQSAGMRLEWGDAGNTPNTQIALFENNLLPISMVMSNLVPSEALSKGAHNDGFGTGYTLFGEGGRYCGARGVWKVFDNDGKVIEELKGSDGTGRHQRVFLDAVKSRDRSKLTAEVELGHISTAWCHLASIAALEGETSGGQSVSDSTGHWSDLMDGYLAQVEKKSDGTTPTPAGRIEVDAKTGKVKQVSSEAAQQLVHRTYRTGEWAAEFEV
ncbi:Gfo/Idh/MocA family protein [Aeoliella sp.]|uniref:Gfo/Idh/MocA family protein n=1 Tax=Aeoliella sp. TaxID=2795800 RepID=UPI003CCB9589